MILRGMAHVHSRWSYDGCHDLEEIVAHSDRERMGERLPDADDLATLVESSRLTQLWTIYTSNRTLEWRRGITSKVTASDLGEVRVGISPLLLRAELYWLRLSLHPWFRLLRVTMCAIYRKG